MTGVREPGQGTLSRNVLVGRATERAAIDKLLGNARRGVAGALLFTGPAGIGKSALGQYGIDHASHFRVIHIVGVQSEMAFGFAAVHQLALALRDCMEGVPDPQRAAIDSVLGNAQYDALDPFLVGLAALSLIAEAAQTRPVLAVIEDAQWLDDESAVALSFVGRRLGAERAALLVTMRQTADARIRFEGIRRIELGGLPAPEAHELLTAATAVPVDEIVANHIVTASDGNPLALVELPAVLTAEQLRGAAPLPHPLPIGERLSGLFTTRVRSLDASARTLLLLASAERLGDPVLLRRAACAGGDLSWDEAVATAEASGLVAFTPNIAFRHPLVRSAVYYSADAADRRRAHAALAAALDRDADADRRAWHLGAAAAGPDEDVARALEASAERARQRGGASATAFLLWRAAELTPDPERAAERLLEAARAELVGGRWPHAQELLDRAKASGFAEQHRAEATWTEALIHIVAGNVRAAAALLTDALPLVDTDNVEVAEGAAVAAVAVVVSGGHLIEAPTRRAIAAGITNLVARGDVPDPIAGVLSGTASLVDGARAAGVATLRTAAVVAAEDQAHLRAVAGRHVHVVYFDTVLAAVEILDDHAWEELTHVWVALTRATGALAALPLALHCRSWLEVLQGRLGSAASLLAETEDIASLTGSRGLLGDPSPARVLRDAWLGNEEAARSGARELMQDAYERGQGIGIDHAYAALTILELGAGRYDAALRAARHLFDHDNIVLGTLGLADLVEAATRCGERDLAEQALARLSERASASGTPWAHGLLARTSALVANGDDADADEHFRVALDNLSRTTIASDTARTQLLHGEWLRRARRRKEAREPLHEALEYFETIGASGFAGRARSELAATGEHVRSRSAPPDVLTPQEAQIARLAASGERNREIAAQLYITTSTVEYHLRKVFVKLGVRTRTELAQVDLPA